MLCFWQVGDRITGGDIYGLVQENSLLEHRVMLPANARGSITYLAAPGEYNIEEKVIEIEFQGTKKVCGVGWCSIYYHEKNYTMITPANTKIYC